MKASWAQGDQTFTRDPYGSKEQVFFTFNSALMPFTDIYYRGWDMAVPDFWRYREWRREFDLIVEKGELPNLMLVALGADHTGDFSKGIDGVNTPETQVADNDYAMGQIVEALASSPFANSTLIVIVEDDSGNGYDHVDAMRSIALFAGPYVCHSALISKRYTTVNMIRTIEEILGMRPLGLNDALAAPMSDIFDPKQKDWTYKAIVPSVLRSTQLPLPQEEHAVIEYPKHCAYRKLRSV